MIQKTSGRRSFFSAASGYNHTHINNTNYVHTAVHNALVKARETVAVRTQSILYTQTCRILSPYNLANYMLHIKFLVELKPYTCSIFKYTDTQHYVQQDTNIMYITVYSCTCACAINITQLRNDVTHQKSAAVAILPLAGVSR